MLLSFLNMVQFYHRRICFRSSNSPESGISTSHNSLPDDDFEHIDADAPDYYEPDPLPVLGTCEALYRFEGTSFSSLSRC